MIRLTRSGFIRWTMVASLLLTNRLGEPIVAGAQQESTSNTPIEHFIVLMQENHTFDNYFGTYPGADGIPPDVCMPVDPFDAESRACVQPFRIGDYPAGDLSHKEMTFELQYNDGLMNGFIYAHDQRNQDGALS